MTIQFECPICNNQLSAKSDSVGRAGKCKCGTSIIVPCSTDRIKFVCTHCGKGIRVSNKHAGKKGKCPTCRAIVDIPVLGVLVEPTSPAASMASLAGASVIMISLTCEVCGASIHIDQDSEARTVECSDCGSFNKIPG